VLAVDAKSPSTLLAHKAGYIDRDNEVIVGLQTESALQAGNLPQWRAPDGGGRAQGPRASIPIRTFRRAFYEISQVAQ